MIYTPVVLPIVDYYTAVDAHKSGKTVKVIGVISGTSRRKIIECSSFEVLY